MKLKPHSLFGLSPLGAEKKYGNWTERVLLIFIGFLVAAVCFITPYVSGDGVEYMMMTETYANHGTPQVTSQDVESANQHFGFDFTDPDTLVEHFFGFHRNDEGEIYCAHFGAYSIANLPVKLLLGTGGFYALRCFQITNAILYIIALLFVYKKLKTTNKNKFFLLLLLICNPALFYVTWTHPEIFTFAFVIMSMVMFYNKNHKWSILLLSIGAMQNPPVIMFGIVILIDYLKTKVFEYKQSGEKYRKKILVDAIKALLCFLPFFIPIVQTMVLFGRPNIVASVAFEGANLLPKALAYLFDLNLGIFPYMPVVLIVFFIAALAGLFKNTYRTLLFIIGIGMVIGVFLFQKQINSGMAGIARYNVWTIPFMLFFIVLEKDRIFKGKPLKVVDILMPISAIMTTVVIVWYGGFVCNFDALQFSGIAKSVLNTAPALYNPYPAIFISRATGTEGYETDVPVIYESGGWVKKALVTNDNAEGLTKILRGKEAEIQEQIDAHKNDEGYYYLNFGSDEVTLAPMEIITSQNMKVSLYTSMMPSEMKAGSNFGVPVLLTNQGGQIMNGYDKTTENKIAVSYHWYDSEGNVVSYENERAYLTVALDSGESTILNILLIAPASPGSYALELDTVQEGVGWFSGFNDERFIYDIEVY